MNILSRGVELEPDGVSLESARFCLLFIRAQGMFKAEDQGQGRAVPKVRNHNTTMEVLTSCVTLVPSILCDRGLVGTRASWAEVERDR
jgi:hypothetical protein